MFSDRIGALLRGHGRTSEYYFHVMMVDIFKFNIHMSFGDFDSVEK